ncbi:serine hydrolase domain-containing protein [Phenylobacterium sp.]|jgi:CubicO group peptidase (beta-lactamase class C family)|uniref:serine hydrolase domain-containing protein n=1 Tax=Phenylobacterium sp. TaxID=1871053 RepID=UPI0037CA7B0D
MIRRIALSFAAALLAALTCAAIIVFGALEGWGRKPLASFGDDAGFAVAISKLLRAETSGNAALILVKAGQPVHEVFVSRGAPVDRDTRFQVASMGKWVTALGIMTLVEQGKIDLDAPVSTYLTRWQLPASEFDNSKVTVRRLLSHTAGLTDGLGYGGFAPGTPVQSLEASLTRAADADPGSDGRTRVGHEPGAAFEYSGGGYTLLQLIVEEVSGQTFNAYMTDAVLAPLGMTGSTFLLEDGAKNVAENFDAKGTKTPLPRYTALAATSLFTSAADMARLIAAHRPGPAGEPVGRGVLRPETLVAMRKPQAQQYGADVWGSGVVLYAPNRSGDFVIGHDGSNRPAINTSARLDPATGDGIVLLETGNRSLATKLAGEWVYWSVGKVDSLTVVMELRSTLVRAGLWAAGAFAAVFLLVWFLTQRRRATA